MGVDKKMTKRFFRAFNMFLSKHTRFAWSFLLALISYFVTISTLTIKLFGYDYVLEAAIGLAVFFLTYFTGGQFVKWVGKWLEKIVKKTINKVLIDFWNVQTKRLVEAIKKEAVSKQHKKRERERRKRAKAVLLDTSAIIDGRIFAVIKTGFMDNDVWVTQNVIDELQHMADKSNTLKRQKGRQALDRLRQIREVLTKDRFKIVNLKTKPENVDKSLVEYCKKHHAKIATVDFNLNKAARIAGVEVLNINDLVNEVKSSFMPGDNLYIKLIQEGKEEGQAVGYVEDGTMIVVNDAKEEIGKVKQIKVEKILQTSAGRLIFASLKSHSSSNSNNKHGLRKKRT